MDRRLRRAAILRIIASHSTDPDLSAAAVAKQLGITTRYVHLLLEDTGLRFSQHVLQCRLDHASAMLRDPRGRERRIADIALAAGFTDLSYFSRAFRQRYGATPSEIRAATK